MDLETLLLDDRLVNIAHVAQLFSITVLSVDDLKKKLKKTPLLSFVALEMELEMSLFASPESYSRGLQ